MDTERFIAKRLISGGSHLSGYARPVLFVSVISTALGIAVMLLSVFIARGFQHQIRTKVIGFGSHIQVLPFLEEAETGSEAVAIDQPFYKDYKQFKEIKSMHPVAYKPGILQRTSKNESGNREIQGVLFKGINKDYDKSFLNDNLKAGRLPVFDPEHSRDILISSRIASALTINVGDTLAGVLISKKENYTVEPDFRKFVVCGIYETGLEEFDNEYVFIRMEHIQKANGWGITAVPDVNDTVRNNSIEIKLNAITTAGRLEWEVNGKNYPYNTLRVPFAKGKYTMIVRDSEKDLIEDTVLIDVSPSKTYLVTLMGEQPDGYVKYLGNGKDSLSVMVTNLHGSSHNYTGGFEINLKQWDDLMRTDEWLYKLTGPAFTTKTIVEQQQQIFNWLELVEMNVTIIVVLMLLVAIINLVSAILVLILERSKMIGLLKSFGADNQSVGQIFFYFTSNIMLRGIIFGNLLVFIIYFIQQYTGIIQLDPQTYFISTVPMEFDWLGYIFINALTIVVCFLAFFLPVLLVTRIHPVKAIKIE